MPICEVFPQRKTDAWHTLSVLCCFRPWGSSKRLTTLAGILVTRSMQRPAPAQLACIIDIDVCHPDFPPTGAGIAGPHRQAAAARRSPEDTRVIAHPDVY